MKALTILLLASVPVAQVQTGKSSAPTAPHFVQQVKAAPAKGGKWYFARTGHAVYCYGPVMTVAGLDGNLQRVATFCKGDQVIVPLKD